MGVWVCVCIEALAHAGVYACKRKCVRACTREPELLFHARGSDAAFCGQAHLALELGKGISTTQGVP